MPVEQTLKVPIGLHIATDEVIAVGVAAPLLGGVRDQHDVNAAREDWSEGANRSDPERLVFIDETAANTKMARLLIEPARARQASHIPRFSDPILINNANISDVIDGNRCWAWS